MGVGQELCRDYPGFECPVCANRRYYRIVIVREKRPRYPREFFGCVGCSVMFTGAYQFTQSAKPTGERSGGGNFGSSTYQR